MMESRIVLDFDDKFFNKLEEEAAKILIKEIFESTYRKYGYRSLKELFECEMDTLIKKLIEPDKEAIIEKATKQAVFGIQNTKRFKETFSDCCVKCCCCKRGLTE